MKKNSKYYKIWKDNILKSKCREYNFDTISSMPNDLLYGPSEEKEDFLKEAAQKKYNFLKKREKHLKHAEQYTWENGLRE